MAAGTFPAAGLQLLLLIQAAHSFVLLTANIEDVKKLAMKFVSESLAEKIAGFIAQAAQQMIDNASEEIHKDVSEENENYNIKQVSSEREYERGKDNKQNKALKQADYRKDDLFSKLEINSKYTGEDKPLIQYSYPLDGDGNQFKLKPNRKEKMYNLKFKGNDAVNFKNKNVLDDDVGKRDSEADKDVSRDSNSIDDNALNDGGIAIEHNKPVSFRAEFNPNEEKGHVQLIATSGDLVLTRVTKDKPSEEKSDSESEKQDVKEEKKGETWF